MVDIGKREILKFIPYNKKIMDITAAEDDQVHTCALAGLIEANTRIVILVGSRISGTGSLKIYPNEGLASSQFKLDYRNPIVYALKAGEQNIKYEKTVSGDDWDLYDMGEFVQGPAGE